MVNDRALLTRLFEAAVAAADPRGGISAHLPQRPRGRVVVIGAGKGSAQMAQAFEALWDGPLEGLVVTRYGYAVSCKRIKVVEAAHPVPDLAGLKAAQDVIALVSSCGPDDLIVALMSGGGSALLPAPSEGLSLDDEVALNTALLASGAPISVMNAIRGQISRVKAGRLAGFAPHTPIWNLVVSDVPGDDPAQVASGPTVPSHTSRAEALALIRDWRIDLRESLMTWLATAPDVPTLQDEGRITTHVIASARLSLEAAARAAKDEGIAAVILSDQIEGEARDVALVHGAIVAEVATRNRPFRAPVVILSGGETTVTLRAKGRGGRNSEFALALALAAEGVDFTALLADTDGIDGSEDNAGAFVDGTTAARLRAIGFDPRTALMGNDSYSAFAALGDLFVTGPTGTNVNDFRAVLVR
ncbi:MAG: glycerate kinase [Deltaproteobacteria bacterium]